MVYFFLDILDTIKPVNSLGNSKPKSDMQELGDIFSSVSSSHSTQSVRIIVLILYFIASEVVGFTLQFVIKVALGKIEFD